MSLNLSKKMFICFSLYEDKTVFHAIIRNNFTVRSSLCENFKTLKYFENLTAKLFNYMNEWTSRQPILSFSSPFPNYYENNTKDTLYYFLCPSISTKTQKPFLYVTYKEAARLVN